MTTTTQENGITVAPEVQANAAAASRLLEIAKEYEIDCPEMETQAALELKGIKAKAKELTEQRLAMTRPLDDSKAKIMALFKGPLDALAEAERLIKRSLLAYHDKVEKERRRLEAEAQERARKEQAKLQARADAAAAKGKEELAEALQEQAERTQAPVMAKRAAPKGVAVTTTWSAEVVDKMELIKAVAEGRAPEALLEVNMPVANKMAVALKDAFAFAGLKAVSKKGMRA